MTQSRNAVFQAVKESFALIFGGVDVLKPRGGTSLDRASASVRNIDLTSPRKHPHDMALKCAFCMFVREEPVQAVTVMNGHAVCFDHSYYTQGGDFTKILTIVKRDEQRD